MEKRRVKVIKSRAGGTAEGAAVSYKLSLPTLWIKEMGLADSGECEIMFEGDKIIIKKLLSAEDFALSAYEKGNIVKIVKYFVAEELCAILAVDYTEEDLAVKNLTCDPIRLPFGKKTSVSFEDYKNLLAERCISKDRFGLREYLETIGVEKYDPFEIIKITEGRMAEDHVHLTVEDYEEDSFSN